MAESSLDAVSLQPIGERQRQQVLRATCDCLRRAEEIYRREFAAIPVTFDLRGRAAGMYRVRGDRRSIRYNPYLFAKYFADSLSATVPHEVAHYVTDILYGMRNVRPHGLEWRAVMRSLGGEPRATGRYDLAGVPVRRQGRFTYRCGCTTHLLSACRHNRQRSGKARYHCRLCGAPIVYQG
jgi:SprT protein